MIVSMSDFPTEMRPPFSFVAAKENAPRPVEEKTAGCGQETTHLKKPLRWARLKPGAEFDLFRRGKVRGLSRVQNERHPHPIRCCLGAPWQRQRKEKQLYRFLPDCAIPVRVAEC